MKPQSNHFHVNWIDGMKINKNHFISLEQAFSDDLTDAIWCTLNNNNYGLLPPVYGENGSLKIVIHIDNQNNLQLKIFECHAVTPSGARIELIEDARDLYGFEMIVPETLYEMDNTKDTNLYIALSVDPYTRIPVGNANVNEEPPRYPFTVPEIKVHVISEKQLTRKELGANFLTIGKIVMVEGKPEIDRDYIPPCTSNRSHSKLVYLHAEFEKFFSQLELDVITIQKKIKEKDQSNILALTISKLTENLIIFLSMTMNGFKVKVIDQPPLAMFDTLASCARLIKNTIDSNTSKAKEELLNYFAEWCNLNQGEIEEMLTDTVNFHYEHTRINKSVDVMKEFAENISLLFNKLSTLEYIGKKKESTIFVKEQKEKKSFLAD